MFVSFRCCLLSLALLSFFTVFRSVGRFPRYFSLHTILLFSVLRSDSTPTPNVKFNVRTRSYKKCIPSQWPSLHLFIAKTLLTPRKLIPCPFPLSFLSTSFSLFSTTMTHPTCIISPSPSLRVVFFLMTIFSLLLLSSLSFYSLSFSPDYSLSVNFWLRYTCIAFLFFASMRGVCLCVVVESG